jgi:hypothetical protein
MKNLLLAFASLSVILAFLFWGVPFTVTAGSISIQGERATFVAPTSSLANMVSFSRGLLVDCTSYSVCVRPSDRQPKSASIPIQLEPCTAADASGLKSCPNGRLILNLDTSLWLVSSQRQL